MVARLTLKGLSPELSGLEWEMDSTFCIGRQQNQDVILDHPTVSRCHAEIINRGGRWLVRDVANNPRHPTCVNGKPLSGRSDFPLQEGDTLQFGAMNLKVLAAVVDAVTTAITLPPTEQRGHVKATAGFMKVQAATQKSWDEALEHAAVLEGHFGRGVLTLMRTSHHLTRIDSVEDLLQSILTDATQALSAERGSIVLVDESGELQQRAAAAPQLLILARSVFSRTLTSRAFLRGESLLSRDIRYDAVGHRNQGSRGSLTSIICALLRTPRSRLGVIQLDRGPAQEPFTENDLYLADALAASTAMAIEAAQLIELQRDQFVQAVTSLARTVEVRDQYTGDHTRRVTEFSLLLADEMHLPAYERYRIQIGTPLHDIGKIGIDDAILRKPGKLTATEFDFMKTHTIKGAEILQSIHNLDPMIPIVRHHHERWDGRGYPDGLAHEQIDVTARIVSVADAFDAMTSTRPYRPAMSASTAFRELASQAGKHFDPECVDVFLRARPKVEGVLRA